MKLTVVTLKHGEKESAQIGPRAAAVLLSLPAGVRAPCAGCRCGRTRSGRGGARWQRRGCLRFSGLSGDDGAADVQLEVRIPGRALTHAGPHQRAVVFAHFALQPFKRAAHLFPEALGVGQVARAALWFGVVLTLQIGDASFDARLPVLAFDRQPDRVRDVFRPPRALHLATIIPFSIIIEGELSPAVRCRLVPAPLRSAGGWGHSLARSSVLAALTGGWRDLMPEEGHQQPGSESPQQQHIFF